MTRPADGAAAPPPRVPMARVVLTGRRLRIHRVLQALSAACALIALATVFVPWHEVRDTGLGAGLSCAFMPDCDPGPAPTAAEIARQPPDAIHTGMNHGGLVLAGFLALLAAGEICSLLLVRFRVGMLTALLGVFALVLMLFATFDLSDMFSNVTPLVGQHIHEGALDGLGLLALVDLMAQPILYLGARRAALRPEPPSLPTARVHS